MPSQTDTPTPAVERTPASPDWRVADVRPWVAKRGYPLAALLVFVVYLALTVYRPGSDGASLARGSLLGVVGLWFIYCVTGNAEKKCDNLFTFAYTFTIGAFALLLMPVLTDQASGAPKAGAVSVGASASAPRSSPPEGALRLVRGCVRVDGSGSRTLSEKLAPCPGAPTASGPSSALYLPEGIETTGVRYAWLISVGGVTARTLAVDECDLAQSKSKSRAEDLAKATRAVSAASEVADAKQQAERLRLGEAQALRLRDSADLAAKHAEAACSAQATEDPKRPFVEVIGGVAVPLFVVVLALIGGAVSISRRIPEYQRRNDPQYVPTETEPAMPAFRVRESVVFQIMQLISAPFLAIATLQVIEPNNLASAATLAFATGFFSETILYMIRGMVNGLKPELTKVADKEMVNVTGQLTWQDRATAGDLTLMRVEMRPTRGGEWRNVPVEKDGKFVIPSVSAGLYKVGVNGPGILSVPTQDIEVDNKPPKSLKFVLTKLP